MCGLAGIFHQSFSPERADVEHMLNIIQHRGPDGRDLYINSDICLGIVRLAMLDSENDTSILSNETNTIYLAYDGEVIIHLYEKKSFNFVKEMDGMFAFALWDSDKKILCLGRDALGIKPLYFKRKDNKIFFASELKAIVTLEKQFPEINPIGLSSYFNYRFIVAPYTIFKNIAKLEPGTLLIAKEGEIEIKKYWEPTFNIKNKKADFFPMFLHSTIQSTAAADFRSEEHT